MNILSICIILIVIIFAEGKADVKKITEECYVESKALPEDVSQLLKSHLQSPASEPVKCFFKCLLEKCGYFTAGKFDDVAIMKSLEKLPALKDHKDSLATSIKECKDEKGANDCDTVFKILKCFSLHKAGEVFVTDYLGNI